MRKLTIGSQRIVLFLSRREQLFFDDLCQRYGRSEAVHTLLEEIGADLSNGMLTVEAFEQNGQTMLFISSEPEHACFRFRSASDLIDAVRSLRTHIGSPDRSELFDYGGALYLLLSPPFSVVPEQLCEFADESREADLAVKLREHGRILAAPAALSELSIRF